MSLLDHVLLPQRLAPQVFMALIRAENADRSRLEKLAAMLDWSSLTETIHAVRNSHAVQYSGLALNVLRLQLATLPGNVQQAGDTMKVFKALLTPDRHGENELTRHLRDRMAESVAFAMAKIRANQVRRSTENTRAENQETEVITGELNVNHTFLWRKTGHDDHADETEIPNESIAIRNQARNARLASLLEDVPYFV